MVKYLVLQTIRVRDSFYPPGCIVALDDVPTENLDILTAKGIIMPLAQPAAPSLTEAINDSDDRRYQRQRRKTHAGEPGY